MIRIQKTAKLFIALSFAILLMAVPVHARQKILVIQSYHSSLEWTRQCDQGIIDTLGNIYKLEFKYLDTKRANYAEIQAKSNETNSFIRKNSPKLVMIGDDNALRMFGEKIATAGTPVVFFGINNNPRKYFLYNMENVTGVLERTPILSATRVLKKLMPSINNIQILFDNSSTTESIIKVTFKNKKHIKIGNVQIQYKIAPNWEEWKQTILGAKQYDLILLATFHSLKQINGTHVEINNVIEWTSSNSDIPVFSCQDYTVSQNGTVGAYTLSGYNQGKKAALIALQILSGKAANQIPPQTDNNGRLILNRDQLKRYNIKIPTNMLNEISYK